MHHCYIRYMAARVAWREQVRAETVAPSTVARFDLAPHVLWRESEATYSYQTRPPLDRDGTKDPLKFPVAL